MTKKLKTVPPHAPGAGVVEAIRDAVRIAVGTIPYATSSPTTTTLFRVPANTLVVGIIPEVVTAFSATTGTYTVKAGDSDSTSAFMSLDSSVLESTGTKSLATLFAKHYDAAQDILGTFTSAAASSTTAGEVKLYMLYRTETNKESAST